MNMIEHLNVINALHDQIEAILDLMTCCDENIDSKSINVSAEMAQTMLDELMMEIEKIEQERRATLEEKKNEQSRES